MRFFELDPEVPGGFGNGTELDRSTHPPKVRTLHFVFDGWLRDDLVTSFPVYLMTDRLRRALEALGATGCIFDTAKVTKSTHFMELHFSRDLPQMWWLKVTGVPGVHDFGMSSDHSLVVSGRVLDCMKTLSLDHCEIGEYSPQPG